MTSVTRILLLATLVFFQFMVVILFLWNHGASGAVGNSDLIQPYLVTEDLLKYPDTFFGWRHSPAPYVFPDWIVAGFLVLLPVSPAWQTLLFAATQLTGFALAAGWIIEQATRQRYANAVLVFTLVLIAFLLGNELLEDGTNFGWLVYALLAAFIHNGSTFSMLLAVALMGSLWDSPQPKTLVVLLGSVVFLAAYSDLIFVAVFVFPACVTYALRAYLTRRISHFWMGILLLAVAILAVILKRLLHNVVSVRDVDINTILSSAEAFGQSVQSVFADLDIMMIPMFLGLGVVCMIGLRAFISALRTKDMTFSQALFMFLLGTIFCGFLAPVINSYYEETSHWRYYIIMPIIFVLAVSIFIARYLPERLSMRALPGLLVALLVLLMAPSAYNVALAIEPKTELEICLEMEGLTTGYGEYWMAKPVIFYSQRRVHIIQLDRDGGRYGHNYNRVWFDRRADGQPIDSPNFIIVTGTNTEKILEVFGRPRREIQCGRHDVWLYDQIVRR